jgi:tRNA dimethylallyltransferase
MEADPFRAAPPLRPILIAGPTAVGKSEVALQLAKKLGGEIVTVDSMQVYRGLDVGTAKPSAADRGEVPHHLIDVVPLNIPFDVAAFLALVQPILAQIQARNRVPILCGGTGLYFQALLGGLGASPGSDATLREALERTPLPVLLDELARQDPQTWALIDRQNLRRVIRAVEVLRLTGKSISEQRAGWQSSADLSRTPRFFVINREKPDLRERIEQRVDQMFTHGLVAETAALLPLGLSTNRNALQALGYRQVFEHLQGVRNLPETVALVKTRTWQYAKRQLTWLRRHARAEWLTLTREQGGAEVAGVLVDRLAAFLTNEEMG